MTPLVIVIPGEPVPFARARGGAGQPRFTPNKQRHAMANARNVAAGVMAGRSPLDGPLSMVAQFTFLRPASWSKRKAAETVWKSSKPDADNLGKLLKDAFNSVVWRDDAQIASLTVQKVYGDRAEAVVTVMALDHNTQSDGLRQAGGATGGSGESPASSFPPNNQEAAHG